MQLGSLVSFVVGSVNALFADDDIRPRSLDRFVLSEDTSLLLVLGAALCLVGGIIIQAWLAERKRDREEKAALLNQKPPDENND